MNNAALNAIRNFHQQTTTEMVTLSAFDMALKSHKLNKDGSIATCQDGSKYVWSDELELWLKYEE